MTIKEFFHGADLLADPMTLGPLTQGHYIQVGMGTGFYVPEADYQLALARATESRAVQFLGVTKAGAAIHGTRDDIHQHPHSAGVIAWIFPETKPGDRTDDGTQTWTCVGKP